MADDGGDGLAVAPPIKPGPHLRHYPLYEEAKFIEEIVGVLKSKLSGPSPNIIPDDFRCPISLELMRDPVIVSTGQTYDRSCIEKWLDAGHGTCPKTQQVLTNTGCTALTPNYVLRGLIAQWCEGNGIESPQRESSLPNKTGLAFSSAECTKIGTSIQKLISGNPEDQRYAAGDIRLLACCNANIRAAIAEAGAIPLLVDLLSTPDLRTQEHAVTALLNLSICDDNKGSIITSGALPGIVHVLENGSMEARENAATTLCSLSISNENRVSIGRSGAIQPLVTLLREGTLRGKMDSAKALSILCTYQGSKVMQGNKEIIEKALRAGVVPPLVRLLTEPQGEVVYDGLIALWALTMDPDGLTAVGAAEAVPVLVEVIGSGSPQNKEWAAIVLVELCRGDQKYLVEALELGVMGLLVDLAQNGTNRLAWKLLKTTIKDPDGLTAAGATEAVPVLVEVIRRGSPQNKEWAAVILENFCRGDHKYLVEALELGVMGLLIDLAQNGTDRGKRKAWQLLKRMINRFVEQPMQAQAETGVIAADDRKRIADIRLSITEAGAIPLLVHLLARPNLHTQEHAIKALLKLSRCWNNKGSIITSGAVPKIVEVLKRGSMKARENAAATLFSLSVFAENKVTIGGFGAVPPLLTLLSEGTQRGKKDAALALLNLCLYRGNKGKAVRAGVVPALMQLLTEPQGGMVDEELARLALAMLAILSSHPDGKTAIGAAEAVPVLVKVIGSGSPMNKENATAVLAQLCSGGQKYLVEAQELGVVGRLVDLAQNGTDWGKTKALHLLERMKYRFVESRSRPKLKLMLKLGLRTSPRSNVVGV
ncbi:hypothetical protein Vadar_021309 [Vaccinium darrowii]|uniref:Uncharacterized protein n=1 Tax=Vaccinium darrowii TaxID=229202 RepID=A0ACB7ZE60_9ERIC|nr:hypothetical protein Vadar_021309 [Vaccinium darrowii]